MSPPTAPSTLRALASLISDSVDILDHAYIQRGLSFPSLDHPTTQLTGPELKLAQDTNVIRACATICAAANQLIYSVRDPKATALFAASSFHLTSALRTALELNIAEILYQAGPDGLHIDTIAERTKSPIDPPILDRILRFLATNHFFKEVSPSVYANNRTSAVLNKAQPAESILANPLNAYDKSESAPAALAAFVTDENFKASAFMHETITDLSAARNGDADKCAFSWAAAVGSWDNKLPQSLVDSSKNQNGELSESNGHTDGHENGHMNGKGTSAVAWTSLWDFLGQPAPWNPGSIRMKRFGISMDGFAKVQPIDEVLEGFPWSHLPPSSLVVDVGGGVGALTALLEKKHKALRYLVQDRAEVAEEGRRRWMNENPDAVKSGRVSFLAQDFFSPQPTFPLSDSPTQPAAVFLLKHIIHDWADEHARNILRRVREGAWAGGKVNSTAAKGPLTTRKRKVSQNMGEGGESEDVEYEEIASNGTSSGLETEWPATKLVVLDMLAPYACRPGVLSSSDVNPNENGAIDMTFSTAGSFQVPAPEPLLPNYGGAWSPTYNADLAMLTLVNGQERTLEHTRTLFASAGWKLTRVHQSQVPGFHLALLEAEAM